MVIQWHACRQPELLILSHDEVEVNGCAGPTFEIKTNKQHKDNTGCCRTEIDQITLNCGIKQHSRIFTSPLSRPKKET